MLLQNAIFLLQHYFSSKGRNFADSFAIFSVTIKAKFGNFEADMILLS